MWWITTPSTSFFLCFAFTEFHLYGTFRPDLFSWDRVVKMSPIERLEHAFSKAHTYLGIEKLLDPEGKVENMLLNLILLYNWEMMLFSFLECIMTIKI